ncbi:MAG: HAMP domain-containing histidine kinase [bacterium]|nr:HAMP domain-containing histidine kinase [bacterium]
MKPRTYVLSMLAAGLLVLGAGALWWFQLEANRQWQPWTRGEGARVSGALATSAQGAAEFLDVAVDILEPLPEGADAERLQQARLDAMLGAPDAPPGARLHVIRRAGGRTGEIVESFVGGAVSPLPPKLLERELTLASAESDVDDLIWFDHTETGVELHRVRVLTSERMDEEDEHEGDDEEGEEEEEEADDEDRREEPLLGHDALLVHLVAALSVPPRAHVRVGCDMQGGELLTVVRFFPLPGSLADGDYQGEPSTMDLTEFEGRRPIADPRSRLQVHLAYPPGMSPGPLVLLILGLVLLLLAALGPGYLAPSPSAGHNLTGEAAHEMRTPLTVMRGKLEVALRRERTAEHYRKTLGECLEEVDELEQLQDSILLLSRTERKDLTRETIDVAALLRAEGQRIEQAHPDRAVFVTAASRRPATVAGDPSLLARAIANLLDNAAAHSIVGGAIRVRLESQGPWVTIEVEDDGPGIPAERGEKVFERFYRGPDVGRRSIGGSGLGLAIVRRIAELHGGSASLDARHRPGARFVLRLPRA